MSWKALEEIDGQIEKLRTKAEKVSRPLPAQSRELMSVLYQEVTFVEDDLTEQRQTFNNGDRDTFVIQRLAVSVSIEIPTTEGLPPWADTMQPGTRYSLTKVNNGWALTPLWAPVGSFFDFQWNYSVNSRQSQYSRDTCCSDMLVGLDRGQMLDFRVPLIIPKSESIEFRVQPLCYSLPIEGTPKVPGTIYYVGFHGLGYRSMP